MFKRINAFIGILALTFLVSCGQAPTVVEENNNNQNQVKAQRSKAINLATTTSTRDSGLLDAILPDFKEKTGNDIKVIAVGTGKALTLGRDGEVDVLLVHAKAAEEEFVKAGHGLKRIEVMYNDFVLVGPKDDPAMLKKEFPNDVVGALKRINEKKAKFVSRGDDSGTNKKELALWSDAQITPQGDFYVSAGKGMGEVLIMANEMNAYTLTDRATYLNMRDKLELEIVVEKSKELLNQYSVIAVNPDKNDKINSKGAQEFINWLIQDETQQLIGKYGVEKFGSPLFTPNAAK